MRFANRRHGVAAKLLREEDRRLSAARRRCDDFRDADGLTVPSFGQAQALARIWLEVKRWELAGHSEPVRGTLR